MEIRYPDSNRLAQLNILHEVLRDERPMVKALMTLVTVVKQMPHASGRGVTYFVACSTDCGLFQALNEGEEVPEYRLEFAYDRPFQQPDWEARRVNAGKFGFVAIRKTIVRVPPATMKSQLRGTQPYV